MISFISDKLLNYIISKKVINGEDGETVEFYKYGIEITVSSILNIVLVMLASAVFAAPAEGIVFLAVFIPTRQYTGGFHAGSYLKCNLTFVFCYMLILILYKYLPPVPFWAFWALAALDAAVIAVCCPVENENKPIRSKKQYIKCKIISVVLFAVWFSLGVWAFSLGIAQGVFVVYTLQLIAALVIISILPGRKVKLK